ncbi:YSC84-related protein [Pseudoalteromonas shioyasakiensis]|uniref:lipid-binding SYLF domain-containing protein n=1 Tax=Pseudoalteromonas shioyasakiensis TaxID=1190813 RepID=UPI002117E523|nr:YSC84-related protein [Pseudoalteromonas shioyasakiensis]MCQ8878298.1 YSC84-related protein [Pseudoalteromonas shioyasakiensis]
MKKLIVLGLVTLTLVLSGCATTGSASPSEKRNLVQNMRADTLAKLYKEKPDVKQQIAGSAGYAVFDNANVNVVLASFGGGYGVVKNNLTGKSTYMNMGEAGLGLGLGVKDFNVVMVFHNQDALNRFIEHGWAFGGNADAAAKYQDQGGAIVAEAIADQVTVYSLTENGLALQAVLKGTKFWVDSELN